MSSLFWSDGIEFKMRGSIFAQRTFCSSRWSDTRNLLQLAEVVEVVAGHGF